MKVAFFFGALNRGGAETLALDVFAQKAELPFEAVCLYRKEGVLSQQMAATSADMLKVPRKKSWLLYFCRLCKTIRKHHIDILHAQTSLNAIIAILCSWFTGVKVITTFHGFGFLNAPKLLRWFIFKGSDHIIFVSQQLKQAFVERGDFGLSAKMVVVHNGINFDKFQNTPNHTSNRSTLALCMVGSFGDGRNQLLICRFLKLLKDAQVDFHFTFVGAARPNEMELYNACVDYCSSHGLDQHVTFAGLCHNVPQILSTMDAFIYSTRHDSFGLAVIEAIASGLPTFVNDWCTMKEITRDGKWATLYKTDDEQSLLQVFNDFLANRETYQQKALASANEVRQVYSIQHHIASLAQIYSSVSH